MTTEYVLLYTDEKRCRICNRWRGQHIIGGEHNDQLLCPIPPHTFEGIEPMTELVIHTMAVAPDETGMIDLTFRVPISKVLGRSLADINNEGGLWEWSGWFESKARELQKIREEGQK